jgi:ABC-type lipoprotein release transport system permease subunit
MFALALPTFSLSLYGPLLAVLAALALLATLGRVPIRYSLRNLIVRWRTTALTALAFMLVVGLMIVMLAFVTAMSRLTEQSGQPGNVIVLSDGAIDELFSNFQYTESSDVEREPGVVRDENNHPLCSRETYLVVSQDTGATEGDRPQRRFVQVRAIEDPLMSARVHGLDLYAGGQWFSEAGVEPLKGENVAGVEAAEPPASAASAGGSLRSIPATQREAIQAILGEGIAREMGRDRGQDSLHVGDVFDLGGRKWIVSGITRSEGSTFGSEVWAKWSLVAHMFGKERYTSMVVRTADADSAKALADDITKNFKKAALQAMPETEYFARLNETGKQFFYAIVFVTAIMSIGGVFGVMNTMFAAVSARKRDIGVLRIVGFARWQVLAVFLAESVLIAVIGGLLGCGLALLAHGWTANSIVSGGQGAGGKFVALKLAIGIDMLASGMLVALIIGVLGGFFPAISAMRQKPLESVR